MKKIVSLLLIMMLLSSFVQFAFAGSVAASAGAGGSVSQSGDTWTATPNTDYHFVNWTKDGSPYSTAKTVPATVAEEEDISIVANFAACTYGEGHDSTATCTEDGEITYTCSGCGHEKKETAAKTGHKYNSSGVCAVCGAKDPAKITDVNFDKGPLTIPAGSSDTLTAVITPSTAADVTVNWSVNPLGIVSVPPTTSGNSPATISAVAPSGSAMVTAKVTDKYNSSYTISSQVTVVPGSPDQYTVNVTPSPVTGGSVTGTGSYSSGSNAVLTATPAEGFSFDKWVDSSGATLSTGASYTLTNINKNYNITAVFTQNTSPTKYTVAVTVSPAGAGTVGGGGSWNSGSNTILSATPSSGYVFNDWYDTDTGSVLSSNLTYTLTVNRNYNIQARFAQNSSSGYRINYILNGGTLDSQVTNPQYYQYNVSSGFALPNSSLVTRSGYTFGGWYNNANLTGNPVTTIAAGEAGDRTFYAKWISATAVKYVKVTHSEHGVVYTGDSKVTSGTTFAVRPGESITFKFTPDNLYYVYNLKVAGSNLGSKDSYTFDYNTMQSELIEMYVDFGSIYGSPKTGDDSDLFLWAALGFGAFVCGAASFSSVRKKREE
ncbi:MAG: InlB B-repeat-containing protein [Eubacteriales bacterium]|nr:InlB B-repeat-containing protein [Eubacteriales bacterium]